jgi:hypothetical protein
MYNDNVINDYPFPRTDKGYVINKQFAAIEIADILYNYGLMAKIDCFASYNQLQWKIYKNIKVSQRIALDIIKSENRLVYYKVIKIIKYWAI